MPTRIFPKRRGRLYITEWRENRGLSQERLADRVGTTGATVSRWERAWRTGETPPNTDILDALAEAIGIDAVDFFRHPDAPSADALLRDQPADVRQQAMNVIAAIRKTGS